jgi:hypothetical protein
MVSIRRRFELYVALAEILSAETSAYLIQHLAEIEQNADYQRYNHERFERRPAPLYNLYAVMRSQIGEEHTLTLFEMLDPIGWGSSDGAGAVAAVTEGGDHGDR